MDSHYILDPSDTIAELCSENGHFLEDDYYMAMSHNEVPASYWDRVKKIEQSDRQIVIVGSHETPMTIVKNAFLAYTLAKPKKLTVKASCQDDSIMLKEMLAQNEIYNGGEYNVYHSKKEELASNGAWIRDIEDATDVMVFGGMDTLSFFGMEATDKKSVYLHRPKFSFGIVSKECLENEDNLAGLAGDFLSFFGEGTLAPRFYMTLGKLSNDQLTYLADCMKNEEDIIKEFRAKLPLSKKTFLLNNKMFDQYIYPHIKVSNMDNPEFISSLFGDMRLIEVNNEEQVLTFLSEYEQIVSSVALEEETMGDFVAGWPYHIPRFCDIGSLQFPYFYEPIDDVDDVEIYKKDTDIFD